MRVQTSSSFVKTKFEVKELQKNKIQRLLQIKACFLFSFGLWPCLPQVVVGPKKVGGLQQEYGRWYTGLNAFADNLVINRGLSVLLDVLMIKDLSLKLVVIEITGLSNLM